MSSTQSEQQSEYQLGVGGRSQGKLELSTKYSSPLREGDEDPSFSMFYGYGEKGNEDKLYFCDQSFGVSGDVFDFLYMFLKARNMSEVCSQINYDFQLG